MEIRKAITRTEYIENLDLDEEVGGQEPAGNASFMPSGVEVGAKGTAAVVAGSTISFLGGVSSSQVQDVLDSTLIAQLAANKAFDREKETEQWYKKYREVLENIGWVIQNFSFSKQTSSGISVRMDKTALSIIGAAVSGNALAILTATLNALESSNPGSNQTTIFESNASRSEGGNFQLGVASADPHGNVQMSLGAVKFDAEKHRHRFLFFSWASQNLNLYAGVQNVTLNEQIYGTVRSTIIAKLGNRANSYVAGLNI